MSVTVVAGVGGAPARDPHKRLLALLRELREEIVHISHFVDDYSAATDAADRGRRRSQLDTLMAREAARVDALLIHAERLVAVDDEVANGCADAVTRIRNGWDDVLGLWPRTPDDALPDAVVSQAIRQVVLEIGYLTVPPRANENLTALRPGAIMDFKAEFEDEIAAKEDRVRILEWMDRHPLHLLGIADVGHERIMAASPRAWRRAASWVLVLMVVGGMLTAAAFTLGWLKLFKLDLPEATDRDYLCAIAASYVGAIAHVLVAAVKQRQRAAGDGDRTTFTALGNVVLWVHVNEMYLAIYAIVIPAAAYAVMLLAGSVTLLTPFLVGYSIDSVLEILLARFDKFSAARVEVVKGQK